MPTLPLPAEKAKACANCDRRGLSFSIAMLDRAGEVKGQILRLECCHSPPALANGISNFPFVAPFDTCGSWKAEA